MVHIEAIELMLIEYCIRCNNHTQELHKISNIFVTLLLSEMGGMELGGLPLWFDLGGLGHRDVGSPELQSCPAEIQTDTGSKYWGFWSFCCW